MGVGWLIGGGGCHQKENRREGVSNIIGGGGGGGGCVWRARGKEDRDHRLEIREVKV